jgi:hypothetical protein
VSSLERLGEAGWLPDVRSEESLAGQVKPASRSRASFIIYARAGRETVCVSGPVVEIYC